MNSNFAGHLGWEHRLVAPCKGIQASPGYWILRRVFRIPKPRIPNSSIKISKIPQAKKILGIPDLDSLAWREPWAAGNSVYCLFPLRDRGRLFESIAKSSALQDGWRRSKCLPLCWLVSPRMATNNTRDRIQPFREELCFTPELTANASESVLWGIILDSISSPV